MTQPIVNWLGASSWSLNASIARFKLLLGDLGIWFLSILVSLILFHPIHPNVSPTVLAGLSWPILIIFAFLYLFDTYRFDSPLLGLSLQYRTLLGSVFGGLMSWLLLQAIVSDAIVSYLFVLAMSVFVAGAMTMRSLLSQWQANAARQSRWLVLSDAKHLSQFGTAFSRWNPEAQLSWFVDHPQTMPEPEDAGLNDAGLNDAGLNSVRPFPKVENLHHCATINRSWTGILVSPTVTLSSEQEQQLMRTRLKGGAIYSLADFCERFWRKIPPGLVEADWFAFRSGFQLAHSRLATATKRVFDLGMAATLLLLALPLMGGVAIAIKLDSPGPIFYSQLRNGLNGKPFLVYKFRSMHQDAEKRGAQWASERDPRITRVGHWLRILRIDELPQIWNVLKGEMSLIGPRPERPEFDEKLAQQIPHYQARYSVKPGITGWAQVMYPYGASLEDAYEKVSYDLYYIKNYSLWLDLVIVIKTIRVVLLGKGR